MRHCPVLAVFASIAFNPLTALAGSPSVHQCQAYVQARIDMIDAEMHRGDKANQGRKLVQRRDRLKAQYLDCAKNPNAYKKAF